MTYALRSLLLVTNRSLSLSFLVLSLSWPAASVADARNEDATTKAPLSKDQCVGVLQMLSAKLDANYKQISTWSGTYRLKDGTATDFMPEVRKVSASDGSIADKKPGRFWLEREVTVRFAVDLRHNKLFTTYEVIGPDRYTNLETGEKKNVEIGRFRERNIVTNEHWLQSTPADTDADGRLRQARGRGINSALRAPHGASERFMTFAEITDPRRFFGGGKMQFPDRLRLYVGELENGRPSPIEVREVALHNKTGYMLRGEYRMGGPTSKESPVIETMVFDPAADFNVTSDKLVGTTGKEQRIQEWEYMLVSNCQIPKRYQLTQCEQDSTKLSVKRDFVMVDTKVNEPIASDTFELKSLGLQEGDQIQDEIAKKTLRYHEGRLVPAAQ